MSLLFHWGDIVEKVLAKVGVWKRDEKGGWPYIGGSIGRGVQNFYTLCICGFCSWNIIITTKILILENNWFDNFDWSKFVKWKWTNNIKFVSKLNNSNTSMNSITIKTSTIKTVNQNSNIIEISEKTLQHQNLIACFSLFSPPEKTPLGFIPLTFSLQVNSHSKLTVGGSWWFVKTI